MEQVIADRPPAPRYTPSPHQRQIHKAAIVGCQCAPPIWLIGQLSPNSIIRFNVLPSYLWSVSVMIALVLEIGGYRA